MIKNPGLQSNCETIVLLIIFISTLFNSMTFAQFKTNKIEMSSVIQFEERTYSIYPTVHYNRVEGLYLGMGIKYSPVFLPDVTLLGEGGYGISNDQWCYRTGFHKEFFKFNRLKIGARAFYLTSSLDDWYIGSIENSLAALFFNQDFKNYFAKQGFMIFANQIFLDNQIQFRIEAANYDYFSMARKTHWALFGKGKKFRENPAVEEIYESSIKFIFSYNGRDNPLFPISGWMLDAIYEQTAADSNTYGFFLTVKRYQPTFGFQRLQARAMLGTRIGSSAEQYTLDLGGLGTLPGFRNKEFRNGNRFLLFNFQYLFSGDILRRLPLSIIPLYDALSLSLFTNSGWLHFEEDDDLQSFFSFDKLQFYKLKTDVGFSLSVSEDMFLINFAKRTDRADDAWQVTCRLMYKF